MNSQSQGKYEMTGESMSSDESSQSQEICTLTGKSMSSNESSLSQEVHGLIRESMSSDKNSCLQDIVCQLGSQQAQIKALDFIKFFGRLIRAPDCKKFLHLSGSQ